MGENRIKDTSYLRRDCLKILEVLFVEKAQVTYDYIRPNDRSEENLHSIINSCCLLTLF